MTQDTQVMLTPEGRAMLEARLQELADDVIPSMRPLLVEDERDERVVADFERLQAEYDRLAVLLGTSGTLNPASLGPDITLGSRVSLTDADGKPLVVRVVAPEEAFLDDERISCTSPLALALQGRRVGDSVTVNAPAGSWTTTVLAVGEEI